MDMSQEKGPSGFQPRQERPSKSDGNASFLRAARAGNLDKVLEYLKGSTDINTSNANGLNALHLASKEGHVNIVTELLRRGANVDAATKKGNTALHIASLAGQDEIVKILVQSGAKVNVQSQNGFTPLYMAAQENHADVVKFLLSNGASQSLATEDGFTPLAVALQQGHDKVVTVLLENDSRGRVKLPALHIAAKKDDVKAATLLLQNEHNVDNTSKSGFTPLHIAAHYGNQNVGALLIEKGADVDFKARNAITPLHVASKWGRTNMVTLLLDSNANRNCATRDGLTPLHCAARSGHDHIVELLLSRDAPVQSKTKNGLSPLHMSAQGDHVDCARQLLQYKAPIDDVTVDYLTPLHVAAHCGNVRTAKLLLDRKCEVNARALNGFTPLHIACKKNRIKVVELLLKYGAAIEATTESGLTPLHVSAFMGHMNIVIYLIQHGANPDTQTVRGETALHLAARANQTDIIRILLRNGAQVDAKAREQQTPLHIAARLGNVDNVVLLLQHGASPDATTKDLYTPLHIAAKEGHEEVAAVLLEHGANQNLTTKKGFTPLHIAAKYGNIKVARLLLQKEADPNIQGKNGLTPLHVATHYNNVNVALLLLENGASPHCTAKNGYTPLHIAAKKNQMDIATTLLEYQADPNAESKNGFTPLHLASQEGHTDMASLLLEHKANVNCRAKNGLTPMHLAAQEDKVPVAEVLVKYGSEIDPQTKAGYTPLHTACHFGQINMIRFLLEHGAAVNATTKLGYTPLHQAAQQGHVLVINLLLKYKASPNAVSNTGQTPLSIANRLGYISVVEVLRHVTEVQVPEKGADEKYKVVSPETMQETLMTDSEDEGGDDTIIGDQSISMDDFKFLADDSITPRDEFSTMDRFSTIASTTGYSVSSAPHTLDDSRDSRDIFRQHDDSAYPAYPDVFARPESLSHSPYPRPDSHISYPSFGEEKLQQSMVSQQYATKPGMLDTDRPPMYGSYSGASFSSSFDPDNIAIDRHPIYSGFLVSFMVDARGGAMRGCRHSGVRIIVPPAKACMPTRVTCKLVKKEKLSHPPPLMEGEALASRVLEMGPVGAKFLGPVIIEVPHFASLRGKEREIVILRSDNGETWREHSMEATEEAIHDALNGSFEGEDLESAEELYNKRITRILTSDFPHYFAVVTRIRQETKTIGPEAGMLSSTVVPQVQAVFPEGSLTKKIKVGLQAQPLNQELVAKMLGNRVAVSPIVTVEPRRRKFHKPITLTIPLPQAKKGMINQYGQDAPTLRLLCSITGGTTPAQWEDITGTTPLTFVNDCASFTTTVSARFWLMDCQNINEAAKMATELYREAIAVPFMAKFVVFAKHHAAEEARLRVFCMTDDKMDKTLETQEHFSEIARSRDVEVLEGKPQFIEMAGNLTPVTKSGDQMYINFHAFRENRLPMLVRVRDSNQDAVGRLAFMREPRVGRGEAPQTPICNLNVRLPDTIRGEPVVEMDEEMVQSWQEKVNSGRTVVVDDSISKAELRLTDIADTVQGDWVVLGKQLNVTDDEIAKIQGEYTYVSEQALVMLHLWVQKNDGNATGNELERALRKIGREDVIRKCMYNIEEVTDEVERAVAKVHIDQAEPETEENGPSAPPMDVEIVQRDDDVAKLGSQKPLEDDDKQERKLEIEGRVHPGDDGRRRRSSSGSSFDSDGEKNEGTYTSPDFVEKFGIEEPQRPEELSPLEEQADREREVTPEKTQSAIPGETDLDATPSNGITVETNLDDVVDEVKEAVDTPERPDENFNTPKSPKRKYHSSSESEGEEEPGKKNDEGIVGEAPVLDDVVMKDVPVNEETPATVVSDEKPVEVPTKADDSDADERKSNSSSSDDEERFDNLKNEIDEDGAVKDDDKPDVKDILKEHGFDEVKREDEPQVKDAPRIDEDTPRDDDAEKDDKEKPGFDAFKEELGPSRDSTLPRGVSLDVSYDEQDMMKESESAGDSGSDTGSVKRAEPRTEETVHVIREVEEPGPEADEAAPLADKAVIQDDDDDVIVARVDERHGMVKNLTEEEERQKQLEREEAYAELARQLQEQVEVDVLPSEPVKTSDSPEPVEESLIHGESRPHRAAEVGELIEAVEGYQVHGMDDRRLSESSEDSMIVKDDARPTDGLPADARDSPRVVPTPPPSPTEDLTDAQEQGLSDKELAARLADTESLTTCESTSTLDAAPVLEELASPTDSIDSEKPSVRVYTDTIEGEPQVETDVQEFEETMPDGTVVKRKVIKTRQKQTIVKRVVMEGPESDLPTTEEQAQMMLNTSGSFDPEVQVYTDRMQTEPVESTDVQEFEETLPDGTVVRKKVVTKTEQQLKTERTMMEGSDAVMGLTDGHEEDIVNAEDGSYAHGAPQAEVPVNMVGRESGPHDESAMFEDGADDILIGDEGELDEAAGGEMQSTRVVMRKQIHKKTIIRDGQEETIVTEDTHVEQDNETPEDIKESVQGIIDEFMESGGPPKGSLPPQDS